MVVARVFDMQSVKHDICVKCCYICTVMKHSLVVFLSFQNHSVVSTCEQTERLLLATSLSLIECKRVFVQVLLPGPSCQLVCLSICWSLWWTVEKRLIGSGCRLVWLVSWVQG